MLAVFCSASLPAEAQINPKWLDIGSLHQYYLATGTTEMQLDVAYGGRFYTGYAWPGLWPYNDTQNHDALFLAARDFTDEHGEFFPHKVNTHRVFQGIGNGGIYPVSHTLYSRFDPPVVEVDGANSFAHAYFVDRVDPSLPSDRMVVTEVTSQLGLTMVRRDMAWSQPFHDNYHITEITLINTGNTDADPDIELPGNTLQDFYFARYLWTANNHIGNHSKGTGFWGRYELNDIIGFGERPFTDELGGPEYRGVFVWNGYAPIFTQWDNIGMPLLDHLIDIQAEADTTGRISAPGVYGRGVLHAQGAVGDPSDDLSQPSTMTYVAGNNQLVLGSNPFNKDKMTREYEMIATGRTTPHHADFITPPLPGESWIDQMARQRDGANLGFSSGQHYLFGYGPYTLAPGDSVKIVVFSGINGLDRQASMEIGAAFKAAHLAGEPDRPIEYDANRNGIIDNDEAMSKNHWVLTGRDSLFQTYRRAMANFKSGYDIPREPRPPREFRVMSGPDRISLEWELYAGEQPSGFEIWRMEGDQRLWEPELVAELGPEARSYDDAGVSRGIGYYYHLIAVGEVNNDPTGETPTGVPLKSSLYYTQTYTPAFLQRAPGNALADARVVPNPYDLGSDPSVRWPDVQDQIAFLNIPGQCTIRIFTEMGELIQTIEHTDGSGDEFWNLTTSSNQVVASGVYLAAIRDNESGESIIRKFTIIR